MKKRSVLLTVLTAVLCMSLLFAGCGKASDVPVSDEMYFGDAESLDFGSKEASGYNTSASADLSDGYKSDSGVTESNLKLGESDPSRKLIYTVNYDLETKNFDSSVETLLQLSSSLGGYTESSKLTGTAEKGGRQADYVIRIPADNLQSFIDQIGNVGSINAESMSTEDVTLEYVDVESRLKSLRTQEERLLAILSESASVTELLEVENALADVRYEIETYTSQLNTLESLVGYSTVNVSMMEVIEYTPVEPVNQTFWERLSDTFGESMERIGNGFEDFFVWFLGNFFEIVIILALIAGGILLNVLIIRAIVRKARKRHQKRIAAAAGK